jgi:hypothetical protein
MWWCERFHCGEVDFVIDSGEGSGSVLRMFYGDHMSVPGPNLASEGEFVSQFWGVQQVVDFEKGEGRRDRGGAPAGLPARAWLWRACARGGSHCGRSGAVAATEDRWAPLLLCFRAGAGDAAISHHGCRTIRSWARNGSHRSEGTEGPLSLSAGGRVNWRQTGAGAAGRAHVTGLKREGLPRRIGRSPRWPGSGPIPFGARVPSRPQGSFRTHSRRWRSFP